MEYKDLEILEKEDHMSPHRFTKTRQYKWHRYIIDTKYRWIQNVTDRPEITIKCQCLDNGPNIEWFFNDFCLVSNPLAARIDVNSIDEYIKNTLDAKELVLFMKEHKNEILEEPK